MALNQQQAAHKFSTVEKWVKRALLAQSTMRQSTESTSTSIELKGFGDALIVSFISVVVGIVSQEYERVSGGVPAGAAGAGRALHGAHVLEAGHNRRGAALRVRRQAGHHGK